MDSDRLSRVVTDLKFLLDRGYRRSSALNFVAGHYRLDKKQRNILARTVYSDIEIRDHKKRKLPIGRVKGKDIVVDGFNVLVSAECAIGRGELIKSMDGFYRDSIGVFGRYRYNLYTEPALSKIFDVLRLYKPRTVTFYFDAQVPKSGEIAAMVRRKLHEFGIDGDAVAEKNVDYELKKLNQITATSDSAIIEKVDRVVDLISPLVRNACRSVSASEDC